MGKLMSSGENYIVKSVIVAGDSNLVISKASVDDVGALVDFLNQVAGETDFLTFGLNEFPFSIPEEKEIILECLEPNACLMLIGKIDDELVAQLFLQRFSKPRLMHVGDIGVVVSKKHWGKSIGKQMMLAVFEWAQKNNITKLQLQVRTDNDRAVQLYEKLGFTIEGKITRAMKIDDIYFDDYMMGMQLGKK